METTVALLILVCFLLALCVAAKSYFISINRLAIEKEREFSEIVLRRVKAEKADGLVEKSKLIHFIDRDLLALGKKTIEHKDITPNNSKEDTQSSDNVIYLNGAG
ncbi:hypothetical protein [Algicola sagamiensis]|uniref:hypothetical protein n=1 Tax=Algicola sagamiensis TaxID=163869 RepID=UPI00037C58A5|nr:hypothetical protein [Algicola sagamiensis]